MSPVASRDANLGLAESIARKQRLATAKVERARRAKEKAQREKGLREARSKQAQGRRASKSAGPKLTPEQHQRSARRSRIDRLTGDVIYGRRSSTQVKRGFEKMKLTDDEKRYAEESSRRQSKRATRESEKELEKLPGALGFSELAKLAPGGTPAKDISPGWAAVEVASILPIGRAARLGSQAAGTVGKTVTRKVLPQATKRGVRTLKVGEKVQQLPRARSRVTKTVIERPADWASRKMMGEGKVASAARRVLPTASAEVRVAKASGREQMVGAVRAQASMAHHANVLPKEGSVSDTAHFWWAQLPKSHRNVQGLSLVREKQVAELGELTSGRALEGIKRQQGVIRAKLKGATDAERFDLMGQMQELKVLASDLPNRIEDLSRSLAQLEQVIAKPPPLDERVIQGVRALSGERRSILQEAGVLDPERAAAREGLVSGWLGVPRSGEEAFIGHRMGKVRGAQQSLMPVSVGTGRVRIPQGVARENKLILAKTGRLRSSTHVAAQDWQAAQVYRQATTARSDLIQMGKAFEGRVPEDHVLINPRGRVLPAQWKTDRLPHLPEGDEEAVREAAEGIVRGFIAEGDDVARMLEEAKQTGVSWDELRILPKSVAKRYYGQFLPARSATKGGKVYDAAVDMTAASIIFARMGYIPKNIAQNLIMSVPHQGPFLLANVPRAAQALADPELRHLLRAEVGYSGASRGIGSEFSIHGLPSKVAGTVGSIADDPLRISAFLHEAAAEGVISKLNPVLTASDRENLLGLLRNPTPLLNDIRSRSVEAMADFSRLTPTQRKWARRFLIIPGWLWAGSRYPVHFAATHPGRSAAIGYAAVGEPGADRLGFPQNPPVKDAFASGLPWYLEGIGGDEGKVFRTTSLSPVSTPWEIAQTVTAQSPGTAAGYANPLASALYNIAARQAPSPSGSYPTSFGTSLQRNLERLAPNVTLAEQLISPSGEGRYPEDATRLGRLKREIGVVPIEVRRDLTLRQRTIARVQEERDDLLKQMSERTPGHVKNGKLPPVLNQAFTRKQAVEVLRAEVDHEFSSQDQKLERNRAKFEAEMDLLVKWGTVTKKEAAGAKKWAADAELDDLYEGRRYLINHYFDDAYLRLLHDSRKYLEDRK